MPIYDYEGPKCELIQDVWAKIDETVKECPRCGRNMTRILSATNIICDITPYVDTEMAPTPLYIQSRQDRKEKMRDFGVFGVGDTPIASQRFEEERHRRIEPQKKIWGK